MSDQAPEIPFTWKVWKEKHKRWAWMTSIEWASEWIVYYSRTWDFVKVVDLASKFAFLITALIWLSEYKLREKAVLEAKKAKIYQAWQVINSARGAGGEGGRTTALLDLIEEKISLAGVDLYKADLPKIDISGADFRRANFEEAYLEDATFKNTDLSDARFVGAKLRNATLSYTKLYSTNFHAAKLAGATFTGRGNMVPEPDISGVAFDSNLTGAHFKSLAMKDVNFTKADINNAEFYNVGGMGIDISNMTISDVNFTSSFLTKSNFSNTKIIGVKFRGVQLVGCSFDGATFLDSKFYETTIDDAKRFNNAKFCRTEMPKGVNINGNRNCAEILRP